MRATSSLRLVPTRDAPLERFETGTGSSGAGGGADDARRKRASTRERSAKVSVWSFNGSACDSRAKRSAAVIAADAS